MKKLLIFISLFLVAMVVNGQNFPKNPNKTDEKGLRQGKWTILFDKDWKPTTELTKVEFYRLIAYKDDKPVGIVKDHYKNGIVQMQGTLLEDRPKEIMDGTIIFYDAQGKKEQEDVYQAGELVSEKSFIDEKTGQDVHKKGVIDEKSEQTIHEKSFIDEKSWQALHEKGTKLYKERKYQEAREILERAKAQAEKEFGKTHDNYINSCKNLAFVYQNENLYDNAETLFLEIKSIRTKTLGKNDVSYAISCNNLANLYGSQGFYAKAEPLYIEAKNIYEKVLGKENANYANSCSNLASLYGKQELYTKALALHIEAKNIHEKVLGKEHPDYATSCSNLGFLYASNGYYDKAEPLYIEVKNIREKVLGKEHPDYAISCNTLASCYHTRGLYAKAEALYIEAKNICEKTLGKEHRDYATYCNNLAVLYGKQGLYDKAEPFYIESKNICEKTFGKNHPNYATSCSNLANLYYKNGLYAKAEPLYIEDNQSILNQIDNNFPIFSEKEKMNYYNHLRYNLERFNNFIIKRYKENPLITAQTYNNTLATKALLFSANNKMRKRIANSKDENLKNLYQSWIDKKEFLAKAYTFSLGYKKEKKINVEELENEVNEIEKQLSQKSELFAKNNDKTRYTWKDVQKKLQKNEVAIEIIRFYFYNKKFTDTTKYMALIVRPESLHPEMVLLHNGNQLEDNYLKFYRELIMNRQPDEESYNRYWGEIQKALPKNTKKIYLSVDGAYNSVSLGTLFNPETKKYLSEEVNIQILSNTKELITHKNTKKHLKDATLIGFPDYNNKSQKAEKNKDENKKNRNLKLVKSMKKQRFFTNQDDVSELEGTKIEVENLEKILIPKNINTQTFLYENATEKNIKSLNSPQILHIATHGFFLEHIVENEEQNTNGEQNTNEENENQTVDGNQEGNEEYPSVDDNRGFKQQKDSQKTLGIDTKKIIENPLLRCGLLFADAKNAILKGNDGILTGYEAMNLHLDDTELVVLSACETGLGEVKNGEGVYGLQRAFQAAGAKTVLMSLWTVSDDATMALMTLFYENWISKKQTKREAFTNAQNELRKKYPEPYFWGAFVMVGE